MNAIKLKTNNVGKYHRQRYWRKVTGVARCCFLQSREHLVPRGEPEEKPGGVVSRV